ncbi:Anthocyanin 5-aromatic acyltransferase [Dichanthelium oligosanthes]|uniref:Anthocyanin 5-aromatic acyltransferase n=1 Tax=Dichanthelium oligosanthes TaxID=888268 RepID=A0A1E5VE90_9POAL|nr:Anthocyanin 5-aromatic acyltransferase [Dichanthelium oligosanthes]
MLPKFRFNKDTGSSNNTSLAQESGPMSLVRIVGTIYVAVPAEAELPPEDIKLNAMEAQFVVLPKLQYLMLFEGNQLPPFDVVLHSLRSSLAATLATYAPLASKLVHLADTGDVAIRCSASDDGVKFVVAESDVDVRCLSGDEEHDVPAFRRLVPEVEMGELPAPPLAVQATRLEGGGFALGVTAHHGVADGRSVMRFVEAWAAACRGDTPTLAPSFDRSRVRLPGGDELARGVLRKCAPNLPVATMPSFLQVDDPRFSRRTFTLDAHHIQRLKQWIVSLGEAQGAPLRGPPSSFAAVVALVWTCFIRCKPFPVDKDVFLVFFADVRDRLDPPAGSEYSGACLSMCVARLPARELLAEGAMAAAAAAVQDTVGEMAEDPVAGWEFIDLPRMVAMDRLMNVSWSPRFRAYNVAEFGWGKPRRAEPTRMNRDGQVALLRARDGEGVQVSMSLHQQAHMDASFILPILMSPVRIVDVSYVAVPAKAALPTEAIKLNAMEAQWLLFPLLQHLLFFEGDQLPPFDTVVQSLRCSLAETLVTFAPLAGKLVHLAETGDVGIRCSTSDDGVRFLVAESDADVRRLAGDEEHDVKTFQRLVPELDMTELPAPVLAVQATRLEGGGVALGVTVHHAVADGRSLWRFVEVWAAACRGDMHDAEPPPCFDRSRVRLPDGEELARSVLRDYVPNLPMATSPLIPQESRPAFTCCTFTLDAQHIERLKQRIVRHGEAQGAPLGRPPSSFVAVVALAWTCFVRGRSIPADDEDVFLLFFADVRNRLDPPAGAEYFGACLSGCLVKLPARELELHGERALAAAASATQGAIREMTEDPLDGWEFMRVAAGPPMDRFLNVSGSSSFRAYDAADFGWGRPRLTVPVKMNPNGQVALVRARDGDGVQVSVSMIQQAHMDVFKSQFLDLCSDE